MQRTLRSAALLLALTAGLAGQARAQQTFSQDLQLITLDRTTYGGVQTETRAVLTNWTEFQAFYAGAGITPPVQPRVDFANEDVLVAAMGTRPSGGYGIEITRVTLMTGGFTGGHAFIEVTEGSPAPGQIVTMALTAPMHMVRVPKGAIAYHWSTTRPASQFDSLDLTVTDPFRQTTERVTVDARGAAQLLRSSPTARYAPVSGQATITELQALQAAFAAAAVDTLPGSIPDPNVYIVAPSAIELISTAGGQTRTLTATLGVYEQYQPRVEPLVAAIRALGQRLAGGSNQLTFQSIALSYSGGLAPWSDSVTVAADGSVTVARTSHIGSGADRLWTGSASQAEMQALRDAVAACDVPTLPALIEENVLVMDVPSLEVVTRLSGQDFRTTVRYAGFYDGYEARLRPVVEAVGAIRDRITSGGQVQLTGPVTRGRGNEVRIGHHVVSPRDTLHGLLRTLAGRSVTVQAAIHRDANGGEFLEIFTIRATATRTLWLRLRPAPRSQLVGWLRRGTVVEVSAVSRGGQYLHVEAGGESGWTPARGVRLGN